MADPDFGRIKRNIGRMIDRGAPESDITAYLTSEGVTQDQVKNAKSGNFNESANAFLGGMIEGVPVVGPYLKAGADRVGAGVRSVVYGTPYDDELKFVQRRTGEISEQNPMTSLAGNVVGGVAGTAPLVMAAPAAFGAGSGPLLGRALASGASGAALGGADAAVRSGGDAEQTALGAGIGMGIGAVAPVAGEAIGAGVRRVLERGAANEAAKAAGTSPEVVRILSDTLSSDGTLGPRGLANMARAGNEAMLADAGPTARAVLDTAIQRGGPGATVAREAIESRAARGTADLTQTLNREMGPPGAVFSPSPEARQTINQLYKGAYATPIDYSAPAAQEIESMVRGRVPGSAIKAANELMRTEGVQSKQILAKVADDGTVTFERLPDVQQLDYITRGLNQVAEEANGKGALGGTTAVGRAYSNLSGEIRSRLKELVPEYGAATKAAGAEISKVQAAKFGETALSSSVTRSEVAEFVTELGDDARKAVVSSMRQSIDDKVANVTRAISDGNMDAREGVKIIKELSSRASREKLAAVMGDEAAGRIIADLERVTTSFDLRAAMTENSKTFARLATDQRVKDITGPGILGTLKEGSPVAAGKKLVQVLTGQTPEVTAAKQAGVYADIARALTQPADRSMAAFNAVQNYKLANPGAKQSDATKRLMQILLTSSLPVANRQLTK